MIIVISCPGCGKRHELDAKFGGKRARCRKCSREFRIPLARRGPAKSGAAASPESEEQAASPESEQQATVPTGAGLIVASVQPQPLTTESVAPFEPPPHAPLVGPSVEDGSFVDPSIAFIITAPIAEVFDGTIPLGDPISIIAPPAPFRPKPVALPDPYASQGGNGNKVLWIGLAAATGALVLIGGLTFAVRVAFQDAAAVEAAAALDATDSQDSAFFGEESLIDTKTVTVNPAVIDAHSKILDETVATFGAVADYYASIRDASALIERRGKLDEILLGLAQLQQREAKLARPNRDEFTRLSTQYRLALHTAAGRVRSELMRIQKLPKIDSGFSQVLKNFDQSVARMDQALAVPSESLDSTPMAWVRVTHVESREACDFVNLSLQELSDSGRPSTFSSSFDGNAKVLRVRLGPVSDPQAFAAKIGFGKVARVQGKRIAVVARAPSEAELLAVSKERESETRARKPAASVAQAAPKTRPSRTSPGVAQANPRQGQPRPPTRPRTSNSSGSSASNSALQGAIVVLNDLDGHSNDEVRRALDVVRKAHPDDQQASVAIALENVIRNKGDDRFLRADVAKLLTTWAGPENVPALIEFLEVEDAFGAAEVLDYLASIKDPRCAEIFVKFLAKARERAMKGLVSLGAEGEEATLSALDEKDDNIRRSACDVLRQIGTQTSLARLQSALLDRNNEVGRAANVAIEAIESRAGIEVATKGSSTERAAARQLDQVIKLISESDPAFPVREPIDRAFQIIDSAPKGVRKAEIAKALERVLEATDRGLRAEAAKRIAARVGPENVAALVNFLKTEDFFGRVEVMDALAKLKDPAAAEGFAFYLPKDRERAVAALVALGPAAEPSTLDYLEHADDGARKGACDALRSIGTKECLPRLQPLVVDRNDDVVRAAESALDAIEQRAGLAVDGPKTSRAAGRQLEQGIKVLGTLDPGKPDRDKVLRIYRVFDRTPPKERSAEIAKALEPWLKSDDRGIRDETIRRLTPRAGKDNVPSLISLLQGEDFSGRAEVIDALGRIKDPSAADAIAKWLPRDRDRVGNALIAIGPKAEKALHRYVGDNDDGVRRKACEILESIGTKRSLDVLIRAMNDPNNEVARAAAAARNMAARRSAPR
jgi:HEAT repeat protein